METRQSGGTGEGVGGKAMMPQMLHLEIKPWLARYKKSLMLMNCERCGRMFPTHRGEVRRGGGRYCGYSCRDEARNPPETFVSRFWSRVIKTDTCWIWDSARTAAGYGDFTLEGQVRTAHRYSWELAHGPIPEGMFICHHCDNPPCVRPDHLFLGTHQDNMDDAKAKRNMKTKQGGNHG